MGQGGSKWQEMMDPEEGKSAVMRTLKQTKTCLMQLHLFWVLTTEKYFKLLLPPIRTASASARFTWWKCENEYGFQKKSSLFSISHSLQNQTNSWQSADTIQLWKACNWVWSPRIHTPKIVLCFTHMGHGVYTHAYTYTLTQINKLKCNKAFKEQKAWTCVALGVKKNVGGLGKRVN